MFWTLRLHSCYEFLGKEFYPSYSSKLNFYQKLWLIKFIISRTYSKEISLSKHGSMTHIIINYPIYSSLSKISKYQHIRQKLWISLFGWICSVSLAHCLPVSTVERSHFDSANCKTAKIAQERSHTLLLYSKTSNHISIDREFALPFTTSQRRIQNQRLSSQNLRPAHHNRSSSIIHPAIALWHHDERHEANR